MITYENGMLMRSVPQADRKQGEPGRPQGIGPTFWTLGIDLVPSG